MSDDARWSVVKELFAAAQDTPPEKRGALLERACRGDDTLRREIESLLDAAKDDVIPTGVIAPPLSELPTAMGPPVASDAAGTEIGQYRLIEELGEGGFGTVFLAEQFKPVHRLVALKVIKPGMDTRQVIARFETERQALAMMDHPGIARVLDAGTTSAGRPYFVMELVRGRPITDFCDAQRLTVRERLGLFEEVCRAVYHAHQKGVIHRDVKPSNVLVTHAEGDRPLPKVIDFGIAKATFARLTDRSLVTEQRVMIGTPEYMSPEQATNQLGVDTRTDVYSLGVLLYELLTGTTPFEQYILARAPLSELQRVLQDVQPAAPSARIAPRDPKAALVAGKRGCDPRALRGAIRGELDWIVLKAIEKSPSRRYDSALALANDVRRHIDGRAVLAAPPSTLYRAQKLLLRHKTIAAGLGILMIALVVAIVGWTQAINAQRRGAALAEDRRVAEEKAGQNEKIAKDERDKARQAATRAERQRDEAEAAKREAKATEYAACIALAGGAAERDDPVALRENLDRAAAALGPAGAREEQRPWEWRFLNAQADSSLRAFPRHRGAVGWVAFNKDASRVLSASVDSTCAVFDAESGALTYSFPRHRGGVFSIAPGPDEKAVSVDSNEAWVWDDFSGATRATITAPEHAFWRAAVFTPAGDRVLLACSDGTVRSCSTDTGAQEWSLDSSPGAEATALAISTDGSLLVTGASDGVSRVWDARSRRPISAFKQQLRPVRHISISPDGARVVTTSAGEDAYVWDAATGSSPLVLEDRSHWLTSAEFSPDGLWIAAGDGTRVAIFNSATGSLVASLRGHETPVLAASFSPDGLWIAAGAQDGRVLLWSAEELSRVSSIAGRLSGGEGSVWSPDYSRFVVVNQSGGATVYSLQGRAPVLSLRGPDDIVSARFSPDGKRIVTEARSANGTGTVWQSETGSQVSELRPLDRLDGFDGARREHERVWTSPDGTRLAAPGVRAGVQVFDRTTGRLISRLDAGRARVSCFAPKDQRLIVAAEDGASVWDVDARKRLVALGSGAAPGGERGVLSVTCSSDGAYFLTLSDANELCLWTAAGAPIARPAESRLRTGARRDSGSPGGAALNADAPASARPTEGTLESAEFSRDASRLLVPVSTLDWEVWEVSAPACRLLCGIRARVSDVRTAEFSPDNTRVVLGGARGFLAVFDATNGRELLHLRGHRGDVTSVTFSGDGQQLLSSDTQDTLRIWDARGASVQHGERDLFLRLSAEQHEWLDRLKGGEKIEGVRSSIASSPLLNGPQRWAAHALLTEHQSRLEHPNIELISAAESLPFMGRPDARSEQLLARLKDAVSASPENLPLLEAMSLLLYKQGRFSEAIEGFERAARTGPGADRGSSRRPEIQRPPVLAGFVMAEARLGHRDQAMDLLKELRTLVQRGHQDHIACRRWLRDAERLVDETFGDSADPAGEERSR